MGYHVRVDVRTEAKAIEIADLLVSWLREHTSPSIVPEDVLIVPDDSEGEEGRASLWKHETRDNVEGMG
ncbi:MAG: hypothetical protein Q7U76_13005 [Nitrospirota bacterium]|nr:hypothetical protein [Nitrospirota bacterium]